MLFEAFLEDLYEIVFKYVHGVEFGPNQRGVLILHRYMRKNPFLLLRPGV